MVDLSASCAASQPPKRLGLEVTVNEHGRLIVTKLMPGPISAAGVLIGDELVMVGEDNKTINQPFSNLSDFLHGEGTMPTKFGFLRPGLRDIIEVDVCDGSQAPQSIQESKDDTNNLYVLNHNALYLIDQEGKTIKEYL